MPCRSRRALLELLGSGTAALLAGCQTDSSTERSTPTASPETPTATASETEPGTETPTETPGEVDCAAVSRPEAAWPVPRRSPTRDGYVVDTNGFETAPAFAWEAEPSAHDDSYASPSYGQPVVAGDGLYLTNELDKGPQRPTYGHVHALDAGSGDRRWASERLLSPSHPVVWGDLAVVVAEDEALDAMVVAFDRAEGNRRWTREFAARDSWFVTAGDHLFLALEEDSDRGTVRALADDGSTVWSREGAFADHVNVGPTVGPDTVYVATRDGRLHALARDDGTTIWTHRFQDPTERRPYVTDLIATDCSAVTVVEGVVKALDDGGTLVWEVAGDHGPMATDGETVYVATDLGGGEQEVRALSAATGDVRWTVQGSVATFQPPVVAGDAVYVRFDESIVALDRADGTERWRTDGALGSLALADGALYGTTRRTLLALR
jgi:outer membrane protein assembly factor BamB